MHEIARNATADGALQIAQLTNITILEGAFGVQTLSSPEPHAANWPDGRLKDFARGLAMTKKTVRWGTDIGCPKQIKPLDVRNELSAHGLKGKRAKGELGLSRGITRKEARRDAEDALPSSEAMTQDQWSEREQLIAERGPVRGLPIRCGASGTRTRMRLRAHCPCFGHRR